MPGHSDCKPWYVGVSGSWKALIEGLLMLFTAMALLRVESPNLLFPAALTVHRAVNDQVGMIIAFLKNISQINKKLYTATVNLKSRD